MSPSGHGAIAPQHRIPTIAKSERPFFSLIPPKGSSMTAEYKVHGDVAVITMNNPPVNGLGYATRTAIAQGINQANADAAVKAVVITGAGKAFSGGADIKEFGSPKATAEPNLLSVILTCENSSKPIVAASTPWPWAAAWSLRSAATTASPRPAPTSPCRK
jgi:enoyl-CoA hydratase/carnithine racemase